MIRLTGRCVPGGQLIFEAAKRIMPQDGVFLREIGFQLNAGEIVGLRCEIAVPVVMAASKEAMMHHASDKEKKDECQDDCKQELPHSKRGWISFWFPIVHGSDAATSL